MKKILLSLLMIFLLFGCGSQKTSQKSILEEKPFDLSADEVVSCFMTSTGETFNLSGAMDLGESNYYSFTNKPRNDIKLNIYEDIESGLATNITVDYKCEVDTETFWELAKTVDKKITHEEADALYDEMVQQIADITSGTKIGMANKNDFYYMMYLFDDEKNQISVNKYKIK